MVHVHEKHKPIIKKHTERVLGRLSHLTREGKKRKLIIHDKKGIIFFEIPLLLVIVLTVLLPVFAGIAIWFLLLNNFNAVIEKSGKTD